MKVRNVFLFVIAFYTSGIAQTNEIQIPPDASIYGFHPGEFIQASESTYLEGTIINDMRIFPTTNTTQSEMSIAVDPLNDQIILGSANVSDYPVTTIYGTGTYWSTDGGSTWQGFDQPPMGNNKGDPAVVIDRNGYFYVGSIASNSGQGIMKSTDQGDTWSYIQIANPTGGTLDKNHLAVDNTVSGTYSYNLYSAWSDFSQTDRSITVARSTDQGETWDNKQIISSGVAGSGLAHQGVNLQVGPDGTVYACWAVRDASYPYTERGIGFNKSTNGGQNWNTAWYAIDNIMGMRQNPYPVLGFRTNSFPVMGIDMQTGRIYIAWVNVGVPGTNQGDPDVYLIFSDDDGQTWSTPLRVNDDQVDNGALQFHCWLTVDPITGDLFIAFYDNRANIGTSTCEFYVAKYNDDGLSFVNYPVSDNSFPTGPLPGFADNYNGEYLGIAASNQRVYSLWHTQVPAANSQGWTSSTEVQVTVDQRNSAGTQLSGKPIGRWEGGPTFQDYMIPIVDPFTFFVGSIEVLKGYQELVEIPVEKYNRWNDEPDVTNHHQFTIKDQPEELVSWFKPTKNATLKTELISGGNGCNLEFKDPWLIDYPDPMYGDNLRNKGMVADFEEHVSPFNPNTNPTGPGSEYKGVFLNQLIQDGVYYSVRVNQAYATTENIYEFLYWEAEPAGSVEFENANALQTAVVFRSANATVKAVYQPVNMSPGYTLTIAANQELTIPAGANITFVGNFHLELEGEMRIEGTNNNRAVINLDYLSSLTKKAGGNLYFENAIIKHGNGLYNPYNYALRLEYDNNITDAILKNVVINDINVFDLITTWNNSSILMLENCSVINSTLLPGIGGLNGPKCQFNNSIMKDCETDIRGFEGSYNCYYNNTYTVTTSYWPGPYYLDQHTDPKLTGNFQLQYDSPCIDAGDPDLDGDGTSWQNDVDDQDPDGTRMDIGAYYLHQISGTISSDLSLNGSIGIADNLTIPAGATLTIEPESHVYITSGKTIYVNGCLDADGVQFTCTNGIWNGIRAEQNSEIHLNNITLTNSENGVYAFDAGGFITNSSIYNNNTGIYLAYCTDIEEVSNNWIYNNFWGMFLISTTTNMQQNNIEYNSSYGILAMNSFGSTLDNNISNNQSGIHMVSDGGLDLTTSREVGGEDFNNTIINNTENGVYIGSNSYPNFGHYYQISGKLYAGGFNYFGREEGEYDVYSDNSFTLDIRLNSWSPEYSIYGNYLFEPTYDDWLQGGGELLKPVGNGPVIMNNLSPLRIMLLKADSLSADSSYIPAINTYDNIIARSSDEIISKAAIKGLVQCYKSMDKDSVLAVHLDNIFSAYKNHITGITAYEYSISLYISFGDIQEALSRINFVINYYSIRPNRQEETAFALFRQGLIYQGLSGSGGGLGKSTGNLIFVHKKNECFQTVLSEYPATKAAEIIRLMRGEILSKEIILPKEFVLQPAYPNPFNSTVTIRFGLKEKAEVSLIIYDILGRKVWEYKTDNKLEAGYHTVQWNAINTYGELVASGVYLVGFKANNFVGTQKIILVK